MDREQIKKALRIVVNVGCGFEGDAEDAKSILALIVDLEAEVAALNEERRWWCSKSELPQRHQDILVLRTDGVTARWIFDVSEDFFVKKVICWTPFQEVPIEIFRQYYFPEPPKPEEE